MARPSTRSQDGIPPSTTEHNQAESHPDATSTHIVNNSVAPQQVPTSRSRSQNADDIVEPVQSSPNQHDEAHPIT
ncbi:hypothetical protein CsatB_017309 [Cannabis sativa]